MGYHTEIRKVITDRGKIEYQLTRKPVKNINLRIKPDGKVYVSANKSVDTRFIDDLMKQKKDFIINALEKYEEKRKNSVSMEKKYIDGEFYKILGNKLSLKILTGDKESVTYNHEHIYLTLKEENKDKKDIKQDLINQWMQNLMVDIISEKCQETYKRFKEKYDIKQPNKIRIRYMTSRWGSCRPRTGNMTFNSKLIEGPIECIEYVVIHEFAHLIHPNHSKDFYNLIEEFMPDWKKWKKELEYI